MSSPSSETENASGSRIGTSQWMHAAAQFVVRRRITLSWIVVAGLVVEDMLFGFTPRDVTNLSDPLVLLGLSMVLAGLFVRSWATGHLRKNEELATDGPYALVRHPLYFGSFLMMFGFCTLLNDYENHFVIALLILIVYLPQMAKEERKLASIFGEKWKEYAARTPRLIPMHFRLPHILARWDSERWDASREYQTVLATIVAIFAIKAWFEWNVDF